jgi:hypothetical protein
MVGMDKQTSTPYSLVPRMRVVWDVLEGAKDVGDQHVVAACRRLLVANRLGWRKHRASADWDLVREFTGL